MTTVQYALAALALTAAACSPPASDTAPPRATVPAVPAASTVPAEIAAVVSAARPDVSITSGAFNDSNTEYEAVGTAPNGDEIEFDLVQSNGAWTVLEIQRDVAWSSVPEPVRAAATAANAFEPIRVIESTQAADGAVVFELFSAEGQTGGRGGGPAMEVRWQDGKASVE
jgi:hypothetical protein